MMKNAVLDLPQPQRGDRRASLPCYHRDARPPSREASSMRTHTISSKDFLAGVRDEPRRPGRHEYRARLEGRSIKVADKKGTAVVVTFGGTQDHRTVYAHVEGVGFIGGWQYPHRQMPWEYLVECINEGILYHDMNDLPRSSMAHGKATMKAVLATLDEYEAAVGRVARAAWGREQGLTGEAARENEREDRRACREKRRELIRLIGRLGK